jgi:hypothetical protein
MDEKPSAICPRCGNTIFDYQSGICNTCSRIAKEDRRFGRHKPRRTTSPVIGTKRLRSRPTVTCSICGKEIRADHLVSHRWYAHNIKIFATAPDDPPAPPKQRLHRAVPAHTQPDGPAVLCPRCHFSMPLAHLPDHLRYHDWLIKMAQEADELPISNIGITADPPEPSGTTLDKLYLSFKIPEDTTSQRLRREGINRLLQDIYGSPRLLSDILNQGELTQDAINQLRREHLNRYITNLVQRLLAWWAIILPTSHARILVEYYQLAHLTETDSKALPSSAKPVIDLSILEPLQTTAKKARLEAIIVDVAQYLLSDDFKWENEQFATEGK